MSERAAFINAILDNPADDTARLVFADWLEEHGEPERAEFIRVQIEAEKLPEDVRLRNDPGARIAGKHGAAFGGGWRKAIGLSETEGEYVRGFLTGVAADSTPGFLDLTDSVLALEPVMFEVKFEVWRGSSPKAAPEELQEIASLAESPNLRAVTKLWRNNRWSLTTARQFGSERLAQLMASPFLFNLREINIRNDPTIGLAGLKAIANSPAKFTLESLELDETLIGFGADAMEVLATAPRFASLKKLSLRGNELTPDDVRRLIASEALPRALDLDLSGNYFSSREFGRALAERFDTEFDGDEDGDWD